MINKTRALKEVMKATSCAAQKMAWSLTHSFTGLDVVSMDNVIVTLLTNCQGIPIQNFSCRSLSVESTIPKQIHGQLPSYPEMLLCRVWNENKLKPTLAEQRRTVAALSSAFTDSKTVHLAWPSWGMWINNKHKKMNNFKELHGILPMDIVSSMIIF